MSTPQAQLWPRPRRVQLPPGTLRLPREIGVAGDALPALAHLTDLLRARGLSPKVVAADQALIALRIDRALDVGAPAAVHDQSYRLELSEGGVSLIGGGAPGLHHGLATLSQWLAARAVGAGDPLEALRVEDWPDLVRRGALLDISRDKVPTMQTLRALIDRLASWKLNQLQLYIEHTFAYTAHEAVWRHASPLTASEVRELDAHCHARGIELVPNQNSLGHFHRWLIHEPYRALAECPEGIEHPFSDRREPFSLCPTDPGSLALLEQLYDELLPNFTSDHFNVGLDEAFDIGRGRSAAACEARGGRHRVYLDFLCQVQARVQARGKRMQFWGDIILQRPELIGELPLDVTAMVWGYEAAHPFDAQACAMAAAGRPFYLCPGTSSWNSIAGRTDNALENLASAARAARAHGAEGCLITDWGDFGHLQPLCVSYLGWLSGAGMCWNLDSSDALDGPAAGALLDRHAFADATGNLGGAAAALGNVYQLTGARNFNGSGLFYLLQRAHRPWEARRFERMTRETLAETRAAIDRAVAPLSRATPEAEDGALSIDELQWAAALLRFACELGDARLAHGTEHAVDALPAARRAALAGTLAPLIERHGELWLARNRPGGRADSAAQLGRVLALLGA